MELKEFLAIFRKQQIFFFGIVALFVFTAWIWQGEQPMRYQATLLLNIGRAGVSETADYTYDSFYRLQADERFADTVVRWLSTPRVVEDIYREARIDTDALRLKDLSRAFAAGRLSSQVISVQYAGEKQQSLSELSGAIVTVLNRYTETLNTEEREKSWFVVIGSDPVIRDGRIGLGMALFAGAAVGLFIAFWGVLLRHYLAGNK